MRKTNSLAVIITSLFLLFNLAGISQELNTPGINSILYTGTGNNQPLVVGLGGSEGGNAWASDYWKKTRDSFIEKGYAFLAIGYFNAKGAPDTLNKIAIDKVHDAILTAIKNPKINKKKIAIVGGSRGGDLALLLASYYSDISCVVAIVPSNVAFPGHTMHFSTSAWSFKGKELPFVPLSEEAVPPLMKGNLRATFEIMMKDTIAAKKAAIPVEKIRGSVLLLSATKDEICPSTPMCEKMMERLAERKFRYIYKHIPVEGKHAEPLKHFDEIFAFLDTNFFKK
ncbi:MAG: BAAT/Acyl-CoA thioester hydrolase [Bacteroidetes bacterium]|jgi:acetyl esterase/lipase|nr:BAAT/Acyl-CoA thioester hydrolase [Bacteroidota bacterium]